jgi:hypothetical protein
VTDYVRAFPGYAMHDVWIDECVEIRLRNATGPTFRQFGHAEI